MIERWQYIDRVERPDLPASAVFIDNQDGTQTFALDDHATVQAWVAAGNKILPATAPGGQ